MEIRSQFTPVTVEWLRSRTITDSNDCWLWQLCCNDKGYAIVSFNGKAKLAHRLIWSMVNGPIPHGLNVLHDCDVRGCINPDHLYAGTQMQNIRDAIERGRLSSGHQKPGEQSGHHKLTDQDVLLIHQSSLPAWKLAEQFNVSASCIRAVRQHKTWKHIQH